MNQAINIVLDGTPLIINAWTTKAYPGDLESPPEKASIEVEEIFIDAYPDVDKFDLFESAGELERINELAWEAVEAEKREAEYDRESDKWENAA